MISRTLWVVYAKSVLLYSICVHIAYTFALFIPKTKSRKDCFQLDPCKVESGLMNSPNNLGIEAVKVSQTICKGFHRELTSNPLVGMGTNGK